VQGVHGPYKISQIYCLINPIDSLGVGCIYNEKVYKMTQLVQ
jgi:hypothetical protein